MVRMPDNIIRLGTQHHQLCCFTLITHQYVTVFFRFFVHFGIRMFFHAADGCWFLVRSEVSSSLLYGVISKFFSHCLKL